jgi:hypothetical protein
MVRRSETQHFGVLKTRNIEIFLAARTVNEAMLKHLQTNYTLGIVFLMLQYAYLGSPTCYFRLARES